MNTYIDENEIRKAINLIADPGAVFEIRIPGRRTLSGYFNNSDLAIKELRRQNLTGRNVFITLQQIEKACYSREQRDQLIESKTTTSDNNIDNYNWLLVDLDPKRAAGVSSTDEELKAAADTANRVYSWLKEQGFKDPIIAMSGNGYHLLYKIKATNNATNKAIIENTLKALDMLFSTNEVEVDTSVFNPARISKLYGTVAQKGANTEERPHRMSRIVKAPETIETNDIELLQGVAAMLPKEEPTQNSYKGKVNSTFDIYEFLRDKGIRYTERQGNGYTKLILDECIFNPDHKAPDAMITIATSGAIGYKCLHNSCSCYKWQDARLKLDPTAYDKPAAYTEYKTRKEDGPRQDLTKETAEEAKESRYFSKIQQLTLLGNWLNENHREDIPLFGIGLFDFKKLYKEITTGGKTFLQIMADDKNDGVTLTAITAATESDGEALAEARYQEAKAEALLAQREKLIEYMARPGVDIPYATEHLLRVQAAIDQREVKPAAANLADTLLASIRKEEKALKLRYGRGFEDLDKRTGSMRAGQLIVLAARPATGKSAAALQIAYNVASKGAKTLFFPLEMTTTETLERLVLQQEIVDGPEALRAPTSEEEAEIKTFLDGIEESEALLFYEGVNNLEAIAQTIKEQRPKFVVIDQLTQVRTARRTKDIRERYVEVTADLKHIAIEYQTTILLLTQLNRESEKQGRPTLENLHESDATGQNADVVLLMRKRDLDDRTPEFARSDVIDIYVVKNRGGQSEFKITVKFTGHKMRFYKS